MLVLKKLHILIVILVVFLSINFTFADSVENDNEEFNNIQAYQESVKNELFTELGKYYNTVPNFYNYGAIYWENDTLIMGIKKDNPKFTDLNNTEIFNKLNETFSNINSNIKIIELDYTSNELLKLVDDVWDSYLEFGDITNLVGVGTRDDIGKVEITVNKHNEKAQKMIEEKYGNSVIYLLDVDAERPKPEIARKRDWTVLGGGITGSRTSGIGGSTIAGIGVKNGVHYLITAGHSIKNLGNNFYQYYSKECPILILAI